MKALKTVGGSLREVEKEIGLPKPQSVFLSMPCGQSSFEGYALCFLIMAFHAKM